MDRKNTITMEKNTQNSLKNVTEFQTKIHKLQFERFERQIKINTKWLKKQETI